MIDWQTLSDFYFVWPWTLLLLLLIPAFWWLYLNRLRQKLNTSVLRYSHTAVLAQLKTQPAAWKRLLMPVSVSLLMACLIVALARPTVIAKVPVNTADMMLVLDISLSMLAEDIKPDRMTAAREAAINFVRSLPPDARIGLVFFAGDTYVVSPPTSQHGEVIAYLKALNKQDLKPRTEIGSALHTALKVLTHQPDRPSANPALPNAKQEPSKLLPAKKPDQVIVLLSDGDSHEGFPWDLAARQARQANVTVHTIGVGSTEGTFITYKGLELPVTFEENTLRQVAELGGGSYFRVFKQADFRKVYEQIHERTIHYEQRSIELAFVAAGAGLLILMGALGLFMIFL